MNILISINDSYVKQAIIMLKSLKIYNNDLINVYLIYKNISNKNLHKVESFINNEIGTFTPIKFKEKINFPINISHISEETYYRLFAPYVLPEEIDRILYLDCDLIIKDNINELYNTEMGNNVIAGVENIDTDNIFYIKRLGLSERHIYINAGVLLINLDNYRKYIKKEQIYDFIQKNWNILNYQDQDVINCLFTDKIKLMDIKYNYQITQLIPGYEKDENAVIIHYCNVKKPWNDDFCFPRKAIDYYKLMYNINMKKEANRLKKIHTINYEKIKYDANNYDVVLSIIVPAYNVEQYISRCLNSIINQQLMSIEIIVVNDGSTDKTIDYVKSMNDDRIIIINQKHVGVSECRNIGINHARGKYLTFVDADDYVDSNIYTCTLDFMNNNNLKMATYNFYDVYGNNIVNRRERFNKNEIIVGEDMYKEVLKDDKIMNFVWSKVVETSIMKDIKFPQNKVYEDLCVSIPLIEKLDKFGFIAQSLYYYCHREGSITTTYSYQSIKDGIELNYEQYIYLNNKYKQYSDYNLYNLTKRVLTLYFDNYEKIEKNKFFNDFSFIIDLIIRECTEKNNSVLSVFEYDLKKIDADYKMFSNSTKIEKI